MSFDVSSRAVLKYALLYDLMDDSAEMLDGIFHLGPLQDILASTSPSYLAGV